jgi:hypothetical protein
LLAGEADLLMDTLGLPLAAPRIVYDPDEGDVPDIARSELTRGIAYHQQVATDPAQDTAARGRAAANAKRLCVITELHSAGKLVIMDLAADELVVLGKATSPPSAPATACGSHSAPARRHAWQ